MNFHNYDNLEIINSATAKKNYRKPFEQHDFSTRSQHFLFPQINEFLWSIKF